MLEDRILLSGSPVLADVNVMTQNLYVGTDLQPIIAALSSGSDEAAVAAVTAGWAEVNQTNFPERAELLAEQIDAQAPLLIGLQEVTAWRTGPAFDPGPAEDLEYDFLAILLDELNERGLNYEAVATSTNFDGEFPGLVDPADPTSFRDIRLTDRDVILARSDVSGLELSNPQNGNFAVNLPVPVGAAALEITRGWTAIDVALSGQDFRFINTHLELELPGPAGQIQLAQTAELLTVPAATDLPVILVGDFNSRADNLGPTGQPGASYQLLVDAGFQDAWSERRPDDPGFTCCHVSNLMNETVDFQEGRIDLILYRGDVFALSAERVGIDPVDRTPSGLWASDHAGVSARLVVSPLAPVFKNVLGRFERFAARELPAGPDHDFGTGVPAIGARLQPLLRIPRVSESASESRGSADRRAGDAQAIDIVFTQSTRDDGRHWDDGLGKQVRTAL